jgi:SAM-dependent methyltransferase
VSSGDDRDAYAARSYYSGDVASSYSAHRTATPTRTRKWNLERDAMLRMFGDVRVGVVIDVPCGDGRFAADLDALGHRVVGLDISVDMMSSGLERGAFGAGTVGLVQADAEAMPLREVSCSGALCSRFLNLVPLPVVESVLAELHRVVDGPLVIEVRLTRLGSLTALLRRVRSRRGADRSGAEAATARDPLRVHRARELRAVLRRVGWRVADRTEVRISESRLRTTALWFMRLEHDR